MVSKPTRLGPPSSGALLPLLLDRVYRRAPAASQTGSSLLLAAGFACTAFAACLTPQYTTAWAAENYYRTELLIGVGQAFAFIGLVGCIVLQAIFTGGLAKPQWVLTFSAFFHTIRLFGGTAGAMYMGHFSPTREKLHSNLLGLHVTQGSWITDGNLHALAGRPLRQILWGRRGSRPCCRSDWSPAASSGLCFEPDRRIPSGGMDLCLGTSFVALLRKSPLNYGDLTHACSRVKETHS